MKKNLFYLFAFICTVSLFTACSDDDDNGWQELPKGDIKAENVDLTLNGAATTGTVSFTATGNNTAEVGLKNVIDGFSDLTVDVTMEKQADGSFKFNGTKDIATKPVTKTDNTPAPYLKVALEGTIDADGKAVMKLSATGPGLYIGTYSGETLVLTYGDAPVVGKMVVLNASTGEDASLLLMDVIPGEAETTLTGISFSDAGFSGSAQTSSKATVEYSGSRKDKVLTLNLKVTMADANGRAKTYGLADLEQGEVTKVTLVLGEWKEKKATDFIVSPCYVSTSLDLENIPKEDRSKANSINQLSGMIRPALGTVLMQVLNTVSLESDGNIVANYSSGAVQFEMGWASVPTISLTPEVIASLKEGKTWTDSPKNLAYWFEKEGKIYVKLNVPAIVAQAMADNGQGGDISWTGIIDKVLDSNVTDLKEMLGGLASMPGMEMAGMLAQLSDETLGMVLDWVKNGVPLNVEEKDGHLHIYLDQAMLTPIIADLPNFIPVITEMNPMGMGNMLSKMLTGLSASWKYVTEFDLGLDLVTK